MRNIVVVICFILDSFNSLDCSLFLKVCDPIVGLLEGRFIMIIWSFQAEVFQWSSQSHASNPKQILITNILGHLSFPVGPSTTSARFGVILGQQACLSFDQTIH